MSLEENKRIVKRLIAEAYGGNEGIMNELLHAEYKHYVFGHHIPQHDGLQGALDFFRQWWEAFSGMRFDIEDLIGEGDKVVVRGLWSGTHKGAFGDYPPTGKRISAMTVNIYRLADGKIVEEQELWDSQGFFRQIRMD